MPCATCERLKAELGRLDSIQRANQTLMELRYSAISQQERIQLRAETLRASIDHESIRQDFERHKRTCADANASLGSNRSARGDLQ